MLGQDATPDAIAELNARLGFDRPLIVQYLEWMQRALIGISAVPIRLIKPWRTPFCRACR
jgi:ABC-type dipeptide/oligopeptide/nickel transport system permease component